MHRESVVEFEGNLLGEFEGDLLGCFEGEIDGWLLE
jgi:hypothetical protein